MKPVSKPVTSSIGFSILIVKQVDKRGVRSKNTYPHKLHPDGAWTTQLLDSESDHSFQALTSSLAPVARSPDEAGCVVMLDIFTYHATQMAFVEDEDLIQAFFAHRSYPAFRIGIRIRRPIGRVDDLDVL